jgi:isoquinoline 1-oxidoreductase beta subunit
MASRITDSDRDDNPEEPDNPEAPLTGKATVSRRQFLTYLVAAPTLTLAADLGLEAVGAHPAAAAIPSLPATAEIMDLGDVLILAGTPTSHMLVLEVADDGTVTLDLPRAEVGQGITTAVGMLVAEEMDLPLAKVRVTLSDARSELMMNQLTGGSNTIRSVYGPVRDTAALARARMVATAAQQWNVSADRLVTRDGTVVAPDGRTATYGSLSAAVSRTGP